jgi:hypothetical protein
MQLWQTYRKRKLLPIRFFLLLIGLLLFSRILLPSDAQAADDLDGFRAELLTITTALQGLGVSGAADLARQIADLSPEALGALRDNLTTNPDWKGAGPILQLLASKRTSAPPFATAVISDPEPLPAVCNNFPLSLDATIGLAETENVLLQVGLALHAACDIEAFGFSCIPCCVAAGIAEVASAIFHGILVVSDACEGEQNGRLFAVIFEGEKSVAQQVDSLQAQANSTAEAIASTTRLQLQRNLRQCKRIARLILPVAFGGDLETVHDLVEDLITESQQAGVGNIPLAQAAFARGNQEFAATHYSAAYDNFCKAYQQLVK